MTLILASKSPRRKEILENLGVKFQIITCETDEHTDEKDGRKYVEEIAYRKGNAVRTLLESNGKFTNDKIILSCDTVVVSADGEIMGKPRDHADAKRMILAFSGKPHFVISGIALITKGKTVVTSESTTVFFDTVEENDVEKYLDTDEAYDKAGAYAIQGYASLWINGIEGDYFNVVGLPVKKLSDTLKKEFNFKLA
ncbi:MAG: septum formation protein Maf [Clostridia bacterium]|nr:septum formation protein Maf [Clostridia bacterium]